MKIFFYCLVLSISTLLYSCGSGETKKIDGPVPHQNDSLQVKDSFAIDTDVAALLPLFEETNTLPFNIDSAFFHGIATKDSLSYQQVEVLSDSLFSHDINFGASHDIKTHRMIDSLKQNKGYADYVNSLDIGMTKFCTAYPLKRINLDEKTILLVWAIQSSSYEACPYSSETACYGTIVYRGKIASSTLLADEISAGDPPVSMYRLIQTELSKELKFAMRFYQENDEDMDAPKIEVTNENYIFALAEGKFVVEKEDKQKPKMVKRPK